jgi:hypothetical protein
VRLTGARRERVGLGALPHITEANEIGRPAMSLDDQVAEGVHLDAE